MTNRVTKLDLYNMLSRINEKAGFSDSDKLWNQVNGQNVSTVGMYCLNGAYGGWQMARISNESGGQSTVTHGFVSKRELYNIMRAFLAGMDTQSK